MYYGAIKNCDIANGLGVRVSLFVSGCRNGCKDCFQPETWNFSYGKPFTEDTEKQIIEMLTPPYISGLTVLGGEPFEPENQRELLPFLKRVRAKFPNKNIWIYTGFTFEELSDPACRACTEEINEILSLIDTLVDGRFERDKKDITLKFRGSKNQRVINVQETLKERQKIVLQME